MIYTSGFFFFFFSPLDFYPWLVQQIADHPVVRDNRFLQRPKIWEEPKRFTQYKFTSEYSYLLKCQFHMLDRQLSMSSLARNGTQKEIKLNILWHILNIEGCTP